MRVRYLRIHFFQTLGSFFARFSVFVLICGNLCYDASYAAQPGFETVGVPQLVKPGETPAGMDAATWTKIQAQLQDGTPSIQQADPIIYGVETELTAPDGAALDQFGLSVSVAGDVALVGAPRKESFTGAAYVFERNAGGSNAWGLVKKLTADDGAAGDLFGGSVSVAGDVVLIGAYDSLAGSAVGAAYVFERNAGGTNAWGQVKKLTANDGVSGDLFGISISVAGNVALVGAYAPWSHMGAAYVFERNAGGTNAWGQVRKLTAADGSADDRFGFSVSMAGDVALVGAYKADLPGKIDTGAAYVFERDAGGTNVWGQVRKLTAADGATEDWFGVSVSVAGDAALVGAYGKDSYTGAAYVFERNAGSTNVWGQVRKLTANDGTAEDRFGVSVSVMGDVALVGAYGKDSYTGAAYVFERNAGGTNGWELVKKLTAAEGTGSDYFGYSVSMAGDIAFIGTFGSPSGSRVGTAYLFEKFRANQTIVTIDFDEGFTTGAQTPDFLSAYGIPSVTFSGAPGAMGPWIWDHASANSIVPSEPNFLMQNCATHDPGQIHRLTFLFSPELMEFSLTRVGRFGGSSTDPWTARFFNSSNVELGSFGESTLLINQPPKKFTFTAPSGETIARMDLESVYRAATTATVPVDDFVLVSKAMPGTLRFKSAAHTVSEGGGSTRILVSRIGGSYGTASFNYDTSSGTATAGSDYTAVSGRLNWSDGDTADKSFDVPIINDSVYEGNEQFTANLSGASGAGMGSHRSTTVTITDDEILTRIIGVSGNLAFGSVVTGQTARATMTITNRGNSALTVTRHRVSGGV